MTIEQLGHAILNLQVGMVVKVVLGIVGAYLAIQLLTFLLGLLVVILVGKGTIKWRL